MSTDQDQLIVPFDLAEGSRQMRFRVLVITSKVLLHRAENATGRVLQAFAFRIVAEVGQELPDALFGFLRAQFVSHGR